MNTTESQPDNSKIINNINTNLTNIFGDKTKKLKKIMNNQNIFVSGLFIIKCILEEKSPKKIDFFIPKNQLELFNNFLTKKCMTKKYRVQSSPHIIGGERISKSFHKITNSNYKINVYAIKNFSTTIETWLDEKIDFDICKNYYAINNSKEKIYVKVLNKIINKTATFRFAKNLGGISYKRTIKKYIKLKNLGFKFANNGQEMFDYIISHAKIIDNNNVGHNTYSLFEIRLVNKKYYSDECHKKMYLYELLNNNMEELEKNLSKTIGGQIKKSNDIVIENGKIMVNPKLIKNKCNDNFDTQSKIKRKNYCPLAVSGINKPHFHLGGTNVICCCVLTYLTFIIVE